MTLQNTDLFLVQRGQEPFKLDAATLSAELGGASVEVSDTAPNNPSAGDLWWDSSTDSGQLYIYYVDANSSQWVEANSSAGGGGGGGDLQSVTDAGNTTTNGATFAGTVSSKSYFTSDRDASGKSIFSGSVNGVESLNIIADGSIYAGNISGSGTAGPGNVNIQLNAANGTITAAGRVSSGTSTAPITGQGILSFCNTTTRNSGGFQVRNFGDGANFCGFNSIGSDTINLMADGSARFAGTVASENSVVNGNLLINNAGGLFLSCTDTNTDTIVANIANNGDAMFTGNVRAKGAFISQGFEFSNFLFQGLNQAGNEVIRMSNDGGAVFSGTVTATVVPPSDARFKENITPAKPQLADVVALGGILKNYDWNDDAPLNEELRSVRQLGLIAQEVAEVCPSIVKDINRTKTMEITPAVYDSDGEITAKAVTEQVDDSYKGLSQEALIMKLIGAASELAAEAEINKSRLNARDATILDLQSSVAELKQKVQVLLNKGEA